MKKGFGITLGVIALLLVVVAFSSIYVVKENQYACVFRFS